MTRGQMVKGIGIWLVTLLLVLLFATEGLAKFSSTHRWAHDFANWGYPVWFRVVIGVLELAAASLLLIRRAAGYGAGIIVVIMLGGMLTRVTHGDPTGIVLEVVPLALALIVFFIRRPAFVKLRRARSVRSDVNQEREMRHWPLVPVILFLVAGLAVGGQDLPRGWASPLIFAPLALLTLQLLRPTALGWRIALGSFGVLMSATVALNMVRANLGGLPSASSVAGFAAMFVLHFGVLVWLLWLARPRDVRVAA